MIKFDIKERHALTGSTDLGPVLAVRVKQNPGEERPHRVGKPAAQHHMGTETRDLPVEIIGAYAVNLVMRTKLLKDVGNRLAVGTQFVSH